MSGLISSEALILAVPIWTQMNRDQIKRKLVRLIGPAPAVDDEDSRAAHKVAMNARAQDESSRAEPARQWRDETQLSRIEAIGLDRDPWKACAPISAARHRSDGSRRHAPHRIASTA